MRSTVTALRDQIAAPARPILLVLLAAAAVVFIIACSNVANLILARSVRREGELAVRAALGASRGALRRTLLAESLVLCGAGAILGVLLARPMVDDRRALRRALLRSRARSRRRFQPALGRRGAGDGGRRAARLSSRVCRRRTHRPALGLATGSIASRPGTNRRLRIFATTQIAFSFVLLAGAGDAARDADRAADGQNRLRHAAGPGDRHADAGARPRHGKDLAFYQEVTRRIAALPGVEGVSIGSFTPWRDAGRFGAGRLVRRRRLSRPPMAKTIRARGCGSSRPASSTSSACRCSPAATSRLTIAAARAGRDREPERRAAAVPERRGAQSQHVVDRSVFRAEAVPRRIVGIVADVDDENIVSGRPR